jgi:filamentous hemagglutinin family protein
MKTGIVQTMLRLLCCLLILFPHAALAGGIVIPGFKAKVAPVPRTQLPVVLPNGQNGVQNAVQGATINAASQNKLTIQQTQQQAIINWSSFNIGADSTVQFLQKGTDQKGNAWVGTALNRIWDANPSQIYGQLKADGKIYLINQNGILFGPGSRVNVNSLAASALNITGMDFLSNNLHFVADDYQNPGRNNPDYLAAVVNQGEIITENGGYVFLMAPHVENFGLINAPAGQVGLAAGTDVSLQAPPENDLTRSGYYVFVRDDFSHPHSNDDAFGRAVNQKGGRLYADGGMAGMYGNNVDQWGIIRSVTAFQNKKGQVELRAAHKVTTDANSSILLPVDDSVDPETGQLRTVNDTFDIQPNVFIGGVEKFQGADLIELGGSIVAPAGVVTIRAKDRVYMETGSSINVGGVVADLPLPVIEDLKLNSVELRDNYSQKDGILQGGKITTSFTAGSTIGNLDQAFLTRDRTAQERLIGGAMTRKADGSCMVTSGKIDISAEKGDIILKQGAVLDVSGGAVNYAGGTVNSTKLLSGMKIYDISDAPANIKYDKILGNFTKSYDRFGIRESYSGLYYRGASSLSTYVKGYQQGGDAGTILLTAPAIVLDGRIYAGVTRGQYQNTWTMEGSFASSQDYQDAQALSKARGLEAPQAGTLNIGDEKSLKNNPSSISILSETEPQTLTIDSPLLIGKPTVISAKTLNDAKLGSLNLVADLTIATASDAHLMLQPGGSFSATARQIGHQGSIEVPAGSINLNAAQNLTSQKDPNGNDNGTAYTHPDLDEKITLASGSRLDTSGEKIDNSNVGMTGADSLKYGRIEGGSISIMDKTDNGSGVFMQTGAIVDVSGGYSIDRKGKVTGGNAGVLSIQGSNIELDGELRGHALADPNGKILGGAITLASKEIHVASKAYSRPGSFVLAKDRLDDTGFTQITLKSRNDLVVESKTDISPSLVRLKNPLTEGGKGASAQGEGMTVYGTDVPGKPDLIRLNDSMSYMTGPSVFSAQAGVDFAGSSGNFTGNLKSSAGNSEASLIVSSDAVIRTTSGGSTSTRIANDTPINPVGVSTQISLTGPKVTMEGTLDSPGGNITVQATKFDLIVGNNANILAKGYNRPDPSLTPKGFSVNHQPVNGGNVILTASSDSGNLILNPSAKVDISGSDVVQNAILSEGKITTYQAASNPGSLSLSYGSNLNWQGRVVSKAANLEGLSGGSLAITKTDTTRGMSITNLDIDKYLAMGFDALTFKSRNSLIFSGDINNAAIGRKLTLDAPVIKGAGNNVTLSAPWIVLTNTYQSPTAIANAPVPTAGAFTLHSGFIDVIGDIQFDGFNKVMLQTDRDIRLSQVLYDNNLVGSKVNNGFLTTTGNLVLDANRIYAGNYYSYTSLGSAIYPDIYSDYTVHANGKATLQHTLSGTDSASGSPVYSAGSNLTVEGVWGIDVEKDVTLAAPMGTITLNAPGKRIYLADGSVLTTKGADINYGVIDDNNVWVTRDKANIQQGTSTFSVDNLSDKKIALNADEVIAREGSLIDVSGGGSVFAYKFQPGVEGSIDPLTKSGRYIVFKADSSPMPGTAVYLQGGGGLSAGMYTLLDLKNPQNARYAFLPDAYILEKQSSTSLPGRSSLSKDGYPLIVGYAAVADTSIRDTRGQVYSLRSAKDVLTREGNYEIQSVTSGNAGAIDLKGRTTIIDGALKAAALSGYKGGQVSLSAMDIIVQQTNQSLLKDGFDFNTQFTGDLAFLKDKLTVSADSLSGKGFSNATLGDANTNSVAVKSGAVLDVAALGLTANQAITVESNAMLGVLQAATGTSGTDWINITTPGKLTIASGADLYASGGITLDVNDVKDITGGLRSDSGSLTLKSSAIFFGADNGKAQNDVGLYLTKTLWDRFSSFTDISLVSKNDIQFRTDFAGSSGLSAGRSLTLDAAGITGVKSGGTAVTLAAPTVNLSNTGASSSSAGAGTNAGTFTVNADQINVGNGDVLFGGFSTISLNSKNDLTFMGRGSLTTGAGDLSISASHVTTSNTTRKTQNALDKTTDMTSTAVVAPNFTIYTGANYRQDDQNNTLSPKGTITISGSGVNPGQTPTAGGMLEFQGTSIDQAGLIQVDGGSIKLTATGSGPTDGVTLRSGSQILAQGTDDAPGGQVYLLSHNGGIVMESAAVIDVSAGEQEDAGLISLKAPVGGISINGELKGKAHGGAGGSLLIDTYQVSNTDKTMLNTDMTQLLGTIDAGGFTDSVDIRALKGNIDIASGQTLQARRVKLTADDALNGQITIAGNVIGKEGGSVEMHAMNDLTVQTGGSIRAVSSASDSLDPNVLLNSAKGIITISGSIDVSDGAGREIGTIYLRSQRNGNDVFINNIDPGKLSGAKAVYVEAVQQYTGSNIAQTMFDDATNYYNTNTAVSRLATALTDPATLHLLPGIEVLNSGGDITIDAPLDLSQLGYDTNPGVLTIRAARNININQNITDYPAYYAAASGNPITSLLPGRKSWGFNLVAGADTSSADPMAMNRTLSGNLNVANGVLVYTESAPIHFASAGDTNIGLAPIDPGYMVAQSLDYNLASFNGSIQGNVGRDLKVAGAVQTATGNIDISVGRDLNLLGVGAIRTTGQLTGDPNNPQFPELGWHPLDPAVIDYMTGLPISLTQYDMNGNYYWRYDKGGNIKLSVGRIVGKKDSLSSQWTTADSGVWDYFSRIGVNVSPSEVPEYGIFSADYSNGTAGVTTMGGGNLFVRTGSDFLAQAGTFGSGNLSIYSGGDIRGRFLNKTGRGELHAMGNVGAFDPESLQDASIKNERAQIELFDSKMNVTARGEIQLGAVLNPGLASDQVAANSYYDRLVQCTYTPDTSISLKSGTDIVVAGVSPYYSLSRSDTSRQNETALPATVSMNAGGDIILLNKFVMTSSAKGNLSLKAGGDVLGSALNNEKILQPASLLMSDIAEQNWYGFFFIYGAGTQSGSSWIGKRSNNLHGLYNPADNTWSITEPLHKQSDQSILVHADGDIANLKLMFPKKAEVSANKNIQDVTYEGQNIDKSDVSIIRAGGDITMKYVKASTGAASQDLNGLIEGGPGVFLVQAGGSIDLGSLKDGIQAIGNGSNLALSSEQSSLVILSGYKQDLPADKIRTFFDEIRDSGDLYSMLLAGGKQEVAEKLVKSITEREAGVSEDAKATIQKLHEGAESEDAFYKKLTSGGNTKDANELLQNTRTNAITPLLKPEDAGTGNINMTSSQIATAIGQSNIYVIANGSLNLGQTALPISGKVNNKTGITTAGGGDINIFARQDVNVNESRVMTFYGGDITVWSGEGSINAGRGSRTAVSAQPPRRVESPPGSGFYVNVFSPPAVGSGIRAVTYGDNPPPPGDIHLFAPQGIIDAGEAGIAGGQITLAALTVKNAANISFSAGSIGMPQQSSGTANIGALTGSGSTSQTSQLTSDVSGVGAAKAQAAQLVEDIVAKWLDVKVLDFVEDDEDEKNK